MNPVGVVEVVTGSSWNSAAELVMQEAALAAAETPFSKL